MRKLFIVVRSDLKPGAQLAQSCHALSSFAAEHREAFAAWQSGASNLVCLQVPGRTELAQLLLAAIDSGIPTSSFHEPDFGNELTACAFGESAWRMLSSLPLALRQHSVSAAA